ncbi:7-cyano-7-deazaguanine synthase QueC [bacterium]|nr:7-cyano-7-deazaguanine synthase QueC [bacterium]
MSKALILFSGGQDSTTCLAQACADFPGEIMAIGFDYGQRHTIELEQAAKLANLANVDYHVIDLPFIAALSRNALTSNDVEITHEEGQLPSTFVPGRNLFFLSAAAVFAREHNIQILYTGVCETDYSGYPDCRSDFIASATTTINLAMETNIEIRTPLMHLTKADTVQLMHDLGKLDWYSESHTCYEGKRPACGVCPACVLRLKGFAEAGVEDPLAYI